MSSQCFFDLLSDEVILRIFHKIFILDLPVVNRVCRRWKQIGADKALPLWFTENWNMTVALVGPSGGGKTTFLGHSLSRKNSDTFKFGGTLYPKRSFTTYYKLKDKYPKRFHATLMDTSGIERERKKTMHARYKYYQTHPYFTYTFLDAPGDIAYSEKMVQNILIADIAIVMIPLVHDEYTKYLSSPSCNKPFSQLRDHLRLLCTSDVKGIIFALTKLDRTKYPRKEIDDIRKGLKDTLKATGFTGKPRFIECNLDTGENVYPDIKYPAGTPNVKPGKETLIEALDNTATSLLTRKEKFKYYRKNSEEGFGLAVSKVFSTTGGKGKEKPRMQALVAGRVFRGTISVGSSIAVIGYFNGKYPEQVATGVVQEMRINDKSITKARTGNWISMKLKFPWTVKLNSGVVISNSNVLTPNFNAWNNKHAIRLPKLCIAIRCKIFRFKPSYGILELPVGSNVRLHTYNSVCTARVDSWFEASNKKGQKATYPKKIPPGVLAIGEFTPTAGKTIIIAEIYKRLDSKGKSHFSELGKVVIRDNGKTDASGMIVDVTAYTL